MIILAKLRHGPISGYDIMNFVYSEFHFLISSGTVYSLLYSLERSGLIIGVWGRRKRLYRLTEKGEETIRALASSNYKMQWLMSSLLKLIAGVDDSKPAELPTTL